MSIGKGLRYAFYLIFHPFDGFWDIKHENRGNIYSAGFILLLTVATYISSRQFTAFLFNFNNKKDLSVIADVCTVLGVFFLWCIANWCLTSLMDGKGTFKDIVTATAYALTPYVVITIPLMAISYVFSSEEAAFYYTFQALAIIWTAALVFFGTMTTHDYSLGKAILTTVLIIIGMAIIVFLGLLFFSVIQQMISFVTIIYREMNLRL